MGLGFRIAFGMVLGTLAAMDVAITSHKVVDWVKTKFSQKTKAATKKGKQR